MSTKSMNGNYSGMAGRAAGREAVRTGASYVAKKASSKVVSKGATALAKGAANPAFLIGDALELGIEGATGNRNAGRAASAAVYLGAGAAVGGPAGAAVAGAVWAIGQLVGSIFE